MLTTEPIVLPYSKYQRDAFRDGLLISQWCKRYPELFDAHDLEIVSHQKNWHFFEWLSAIVLYESTGYLSLVEQYEFPSHTRKQEVLDKLVEKLVMKNDVRLLIRDHSSKFGNVQCPDLLVYATDYSDWFCCEVKGPKDKLKERPALFFKELESVSGKSVRILKFRRFDK